MALIINHSGGSECHRLGTELGLVLTCKALVRDVVVLFLAMYLLINVNRISLSAFLSFLPIYLSFVVLPPF